MNRYPLWVYVTVAVAIALGFLYTLPNFFGEAPAVQVSSAKATIRVDADTLGRAEAALRRAKIDYTGTQLDPNTIRIRIDRKSTRLNSSH